MDCLQSTSHVSDAREFQREPVRACCDLLWRWRTDSGLIAYGFACRGLGEGPSTKIAAFDLVRYPAYDTNPEDLYSVRRQARVEIAQNMMASAHNDAGWHASSAEEPESVPKGCR